MPKDDYTAVAGGRLKLKGVSDARIDKRKKKKKEKSKEKEKERDRSGSEAPAKTTTTGEEGIEKSKPEDGESRSISRSTSEAPPLYIGKTEAERRFEERKRRRLGERLMKEGAKSHKERVEDFNKYLANLSEHHDMPRIGPG